MSFPDAASLEGASLAELRELVGVLAAEITRLRSDNAALREADEERQAAIAALRDEKTGLWGETRSGPRKATV